jgi:hypothetical protein
VLTNLILKVPLSYRFVSRSTPRSSLEQGSFTKSDVAKLLNSQYLYLLKQMAKKLNTFSIKRGSPPCFYYKAPGFTGSCSYAFTMP